MGGGDLNTKKSWHPNTLKNQGRVWRAERAAAQEQARVAELRRERGGERARDELRTLGRGAGTLPGASETDALSWMYNQPNKSGETEDYLLGKTIDKNYERLVAEDKTSAPPKNHVEHEVIPFSIRQLRGGLAASVPDTQVDMARKLQEDPLAAIQRRELEARAQLLQNPLRLQQLHKLLRADQEKRKEKKDKKKSKKNKSSLDAILAEKLSGLQGKNIDLASLLSGDKKKKKNKKLNSDSSMDSSEDEKQKKRKKKCKDSVSQEERPRKMKKHNPDSNCNDNTLRKKKHKHTDVKEERSGHKKQLDSDSNDNSSRRKERRTRTPDKEELTRNLKMKLDAITSHLENRYAGKTKRQDSDIISEDKMRKNRRDLSDSEAKSKKSKKKLEKHRDAEVISYKSKKSRDLDEELIKKRKNSDTDELSKKKSKQKSHTKVRSPTPKSSKQRQEYIESPRVKRSPPRRHSSSDSETECRPTHYGLVAADGSKLTTSKSCATEKKQQTSKKEDTWKRPVVEKLSREEKEKKLREMVSAGEERNVEREVNMRRHRETAKREEAAAASSEFDPEFATRQAARAAGGSVRDRIRSNVYNIQRSDRHMDVNFAKR